ncbi:DUF1381 domain-containing protein [Staphylococcus lugdunensis]|nr:DUF1381 domain-containing protein [Staphylococcus lugdunensis]MCI2753640.1 DUF1381 domain-containing protein [Staphylococcus lugdunensis]MCI2756635.1 DUF1381 domain-containing protein [Staphylococcus lugdunensis]MCI2782155.1 DUF1381 domain-containing protein [Staphylococcus lugdunensis]MCI2797522.1 DUF1381 domain-containing protein [Staphylococcus lugdunensis]
MTQFLITEIKHGQETFVDVTKPHDNETYTLVEAESKSEALSKYEEGYND